MTWKGRRVLITGADGFIGSHVTEALVRAGADVHAFCMYNSNGSAGWLDTSAEDIRASLTVHLGDIRDPKVVSDACCSIDVVFHLAALVAIPYSYVTPDSYIETNVRGTLNVLQAVCGHECTRLVATSTSEVYGTPSTLPITETHPLQGQSPYSATKIAADKLCESFWNSFETPVVVLRPFNTYGPRQSARAVIPTILRQLLAGVDRVKLGSLDPRRDMTYVEDTVAGFLAAGMAPGIEGRTVQLGTGRTESIREIFDTAVQVTGVDATVEHDKNRVRPARSEVMVLQSDPTLARELLGWEATVSLEDGIRLTVDWMRERPAVANPSSYVI